MFVNSDALYLPSIYQDLFIHRSGLNGWNLNSAPTFFPEMLLYFPMMALLKGTALTSMAYGLVQIFLLMLLTDRFLILADERISSTTRYLIAFSFLLFPLSALLGDRPIISAQVFLSGYHSGSFIISLLATILSLTYIKMGGRARLAFLGVIIFLAVISDKLFIMSFVAPVILFSLLQVSRHGKRPRYLVLIALLALTTFLGLITFNLIDKSETIDIIPVHAKMFQFQDIPKAMHTLADHLKRVIITYPTQRILVLLTLLFILGAPVYLLFNLRPYLSRRLKPDLDISYSLTLFLLLFVLLVLFTPVINGYYIGPSHTRYNYPAFIMGSAGFLYLIARLLSPLALPLWLKKHFTSFCTILVFIVLLVWGVKNDSVKGLRQYVNHYPESVRILDELKTKHELKYGLSGYWQAKYSTLFSRNDLRLYSISNKSFMPSSFHSRNENWYHDGGKGSHANPVFNFLETNAFSDTEKLKHLFGEKIDTLYKQNDLLVIKVPDFKIDRESREIYLTVQ